jgi:hypothetical protein
VTTIRRKRAQGVVVTCLVVAMLTAVIFTLDQSSATFTGTSTNPANSFTADTLDRTGSLSSNRPCAAVPGAAPIYHAGTNLHGSAGATVTITTPTSTAGDYFIVSLLIYNNPSPPAPNTPAGWTQMESNTTGIYRLTTYSMPRPASPAANYTFTWTGTAGVYIIMQSYTGVTAVQDTNASTGANTSALAPSVTAATAANLLLASFAFNGTSITTPAGMTARDALTPGNGLATFTQTIAATGATGTRSATTGSSGWDGHSILLAGTSSTVNPGIDLSWTATPDTYATGYEIIRTVPAAGPTTPVAGRTTLAWSDTSTIAATAYTYTITAAIGNWRSATRTVNVAVCP